ncbi:hypothetical protein [Fontivita pretiosa]|uniref:hypothetical protein n=1 Tax=Fontivita pretiosa TaxID=2989684 RepID=UPI003D17B2C4
MPERDWPAEADRLRGALTPEHLAALAGATGVPVEAWAKLAPGWAEADDLRAMHAGGGEGWRENPPGSAWVFAEVSGDGRTVGLSLRARDGRKGSPAGAKRGLVVPADLHERPDPVLVVEGASDVAACCALGLAAVGRPSNRAGAADLADLLDGRGVLVVGERDGKPSGAWPGRDGAKAVAQQLAAKWGEPVAWTLPPLGIKDIRDWLRAKIAGGLNTADPDTMRAAGAELLGELKQAAKTARPQKRTQADALVDLACQRFSLGMSTDGDAFAVARDGPNIALMFRGSGGSLRAELARLYRHVVGKAPSSSALADALLTLEGMAADAPREPVALRLAEHAGGVVLDLADADGRAVVIGPDGWEVAPSSPVLFRRTALTGALPEPQQAEPAVLGELRALLNVTNESWPLVVGWLVAALMPGIPHPVLMLGGEQGTGKSTAARLLVGLIDPSAAPLRTEPRDLEQWATAAAGSWIVALDNVSGISTWLSDAICRAVTGDGLVRRKLYTDSDLAVLSFRRCVAITSIDPGALRGDLGDRLLLVDLERIPDDQRRKDAEIAAAFEWMRPRLLGALLSALARTLAALPGVKLDALPRMADFACVLAALDQSCSELTGGRALDLFVGQRERVAEEVVEGDPIGQAIVRFMDLRESWTGTAAELLAAITPDRPPRGWPGSARALAGRLRRVVPALRGVGVAVSFSRQGEKGTRIVHIEKSGGEPSVPSVPSGNPPGEPESGIGTDGRLTVTDGRLTVTDGRADDNRQPKTPGKTAAADGTDGTDGRIQPISADHENAADEAEIAMAKVREAWAQANAGVPDADDEFLSLSLEAAARQYAGKPLAEFGAAELRRFLANGFGLIPPANDLKGGGR